MATIPSTEPQKVFHKFPEFKPFYSPADCLALGVFGGNYFYLSSKRKNIPPDFFRGFAESSYRNPVASDLVNYFGVYAPERNRISIPGIFKDDSLGWFHWYTAFYVGGCGSIDINRLRVGQWLDEIKTLSYYIQKMENPDKWTNPLLGRVWKQQLLQFAWDPTKDPKDYLLLC